MKPKVKITKSEAEQLQRILKEPGVSTGIIPQLILGSFLRKNKTNFNLNTKHSENTEPSNSTKPVLPAVYPLIDNKRWYAENGTVYNKADEYRILLVAGKCSEMRLPNDVAEKIAEYLNGR